MASKAAAKRVSQSVIDWARLAAVFPKSQTETLRTIKAKHDNFINKVHQLPEKLPKIDFAAYKARLPNPAMADQFQKSYESLSIPFPADKSNVLQAVESENADMEKQVKEFKTSVQKEIEESKAYLSKLDTLPKFEDMTEEAFNYYFPDTGYDPQRPTFWPHHEEDQPYNPEFKYIK